MNTFQYILIFIKRLNKYAVMHRNTETDVILMPDDLVFKHFKDTHEQIITLVLKWS